MSAQFNITIRDYLIGGESGPCVDARELHAAIGVRRDFSTWIRDRVYKYKFLENKDFIIFPKSGENSGRGRPEAVYLLTLDMAKELSMVENNDMGRAVRRYFIAAEKMLRKAAQQMAETGKASAPARGQSLEIAERMDKICRYISGLYGFGGSGFRRLDDMTQEDVYSLLMPVLEWASMPSA